MLWGQKPRSLTGASLGHLTPPQNLLGTRPVTGAEKANYEAPRLAKAGALPGKPRAPRSPPTQRWGPPSLRCPQPGLENAAAAAASGHTCGPGPHLHQVARPPTTAPPGFRVSAIRRRARGPTTSPLPDASLRAAPAAGRLSPPQRIRHLETQDSGL